jgi:hypothetical protein
VISEVKQREAKRAVPWSVYKRSEVKVLVKCVHLLQDMVFYFCIVWLAHCFVYLIIFNSDSSTLGFFLLGSATLSFCSMCFVFVCCVLFWVQYYFSWCVLFCVVIVVPLPPGINPLAVINNIFKAHVPYYVVMWPVWLYHIFPHYLINSTIFGNKLLNIKCMFWFSLQHVWNISHSKKNSARYKYALVLM